MKHIFSGTIFILFTNILAAQEGTEAVTVTDMLKIKTASNISLTKDGTKAAFTLTSIEADDTNKGDYKYINQVYTINTTGASLPRKLTTAKEGASQPVWSPDGERLAFVRTVESKPQIFLLSLQGGEPVQLTKYRYGAT